MARTGGDFSKGSVSSNIIRLGLPIMAAEFVHVLYSLVDRMFIGHMPSEGTNALTGIGVAFPLITLIGAFANLCGTGGAPLSSIARGEGNDEKAARIQQTAYTALIGIGAVLTVILFVLAPDLLRILGGDEHTLPYATSYFRVYVIGTVPVLLSLGMNPFINAQGRSDIGMWTVVIGAAANLALDPLFIFVFRMGVTGAALATVISQTMSALWVILFLRGKHAILPLSGLGIDPDSLKGMLKLGVTGFTFKVTNSVTQALVNMTLRAFGGVSATLYVGAMSVINSLREVTSLPTSGVSTGAQPVMGYNYGAGKYGRVKAAIRFTLVGTLIINLCTWALVMLAPGLLIRIFSSDKALIDLTKHCCRIYFIVFPLMSMQMTGQNTFVALNRPKFALFFSLLRKFLLIAPLTLLLPRIGLGVEGVFWAEAISQLVGATACYLTMYFTIQRRLGDEA